MFSPFERLVAFRYLRARRQEGFISVIAGFSLLGIALGVATLIVVMSVMNGFRAEFLKQILGFNGDFTIYARDGRLPDYGALVTQIQAVPGVTRAVAVVEGQVVATNGNGWSGVQVRGVALDDLRAQADIAHHLIEGSLDDLDRDSVLLGNQLAGKLGLKVGDTVTLMSPQGTATAFGSFPRQKGYRIAGLFATGSQYDSLYVFMPIDAAQLFFKVPGAATGIEVFVEDRESLWLYRGPLQAAVGVNGRVYDWQHGNDAFLNAVQTERNVMFFILTLIIVVAAFNVISSMIMLVRSKGRDIAILRTMGATRGMVMRIFLLTGASIGIIGTLSGLGLGVAFALNIESIRHVLEGLTGTDLFSSEIYFLAHLPAKIDWTEVGLVTAMSLTLSFGATLYPAWRAARLDPVEALRYE